MSKEELLKYLIAEIDLIMHDKDYRFENRDGTWYSRESCRDLTNEEVFEELKAELMQLNSQVEQIADLEAKLAESEKNYTELFCRNIELETLYSQKTALVNFYKDTDLVKENKKLKQQLAEKEKLLKKYASTSCPIYQGKITFAVDILEELADCSNYIDSKLDFECGSYVSEKAIRDKIKYLKGKKDE